MKKCIHVGLAFDHNYLTPFFVVLTSIFANNKESEFNIHAIATGVNAEDIRKIENFVRRNNSKIFFYKIEADQLAGLVTLKDSYLSIAAYYRLFFPFLVPESVEKLLYLDSDIVVIESLEELYNTDIRNYPYGAVAEVNATVNRPDLGIFERGIYFNSGVMLINIAEWKKQRVSERAIQYVHENPEKIVFADQDALNATADNKYYKLDPKYNVLPFDIPGHFSKRQYQEFLKDKVVMHYTLPACKPWKTHSTHPFKSLYRKYFYKSPCSKEKLYNDFELTPGFLLKGFKQTFRIFKSDRWTVFLKQRLKDVLQPFG
ncbi:MAG TPA: glycosyltransferase family 8 protein [Segetibacter sp.]